jgi:hypothetical protein
MKASSYRSKEGLQNLLYSLVTAAAVTAFLWVTRCNDVTLVETIAGFFLFLIPWHSYRQWRRLHEDELPFFAIIAFMYWLYYGLQVFCGDLAVDIANSRYGHQVDPSSIGDALLMALLGVSCLWLGTKSGLARLVTPRKIPQITINPRRWNYVRGLLIFSTLVSALEPSNYLFGAGGRQAFETFLSTIPVMSFVLLFRRYLRKEAVLIDKLLIVGFLVTRSITGISSGWLGSFAMLIVVCGASYAVESRRIPRFALVAAVACILFFQVGKNDFRVAYWNQESQAGQGERVAFWVNSSLERWDDALKDPSGESLRRVLGSTLSRLSLVTQTGDVLEKTPSVVPYQYGRLYSYLLYTWIPRAIWPEKPTMSEANQFYQVAYGVTAEEDLDKVSIAVGVLTEGFMNFGWFGVVLIMFLLGAFLDLYRRLFFGKSAGVILGALGMVLLPHMLAIESQMAQYLGGIVQQVLFTLFVFLPVIQYSRPARQGAPLPVGLGYREYSPIRINLLHGKN